MAEGEESSLELPSKATHGANNNSSLHKGRGLMGGDQPIESRVFQPAAQGGTLGLGLAGHVSWNQTTSVACVKLYVPPK